VLFDDHRSLLSGPCHLNSRVHLLLLKVFLLDAISIRRDIFLLVDIAGLCPRRFSAHSTKMIKFVGLHCPKVLSSVLRNVGLHGDFVNLFTTETSVRGLFDCDKNQILALCSGVPSQKFFY